MADQRVQYKERATAANDPNYPDVVNRLALVEHNNDGTHKKLTQVTDPWVDVRAYGAKGDGVTDDTTAIQNAINSLTNGGTVFLPAATYLANVTISTSNISLVGAGRRTTILKPKTNAPVITITSVGGSIISNVVRDLNLTNAGGNTSYGIQITGTNINDHHLFKRLYITGFQSGLYINGRSIWNIFEDMEITSSLGDGIAVTGNSNTMAFNLNRFKNVSSNNNAGHGISITDTGPVSTPGWLTNSFDTCNFQANTLNGFYVNGGNGGLAGGGGLTNSYIEANGGEGFKATGTLLIGFDIKNNLIWNSTGTYDIDVQSVLATGTYAGNRTSKPNYIATSHTNSMIFLQTSYGGAWTVINDINGFSHVTYLNQGNVYNASYVQQANTHIVQDTVTLAVGTATVTLAGQSAFTSATSYTCIAQDETAANPVKVTQTSGTSITFTGTGSDVIRYICVGN